MSDANILGAELYIDDRKAEAVLNNFPNKLRKTQSEIDKIGEKSNFGKGATESLDQLEKKAEGVRSYLSHSFSSGFGAATLAIGGAVAGFKTFSDAADAAIQKSIESARAQRLLSSAATELGVTYDELNEKNKKYAEQAGLSNIAASNLTSQIARLARGTGQPENLDRIYKSFLDLGAARGIGGNELENLIGTILSGQDEGLNRLGLPDPSKLYAQYASQIGKTSDELTQFERVQAAVNAVMQKGEIFAGANAAKMNSLEGTVLKNSAAWENLTTSLSNNFARSYEVTNFLSETNRLLKQATGNLDELQTKAAKGVKISDQEIRDAAKPNVLVEEATSVGRGFLRFMSGFASLPNILTGGALDPFKSSADKFALAANNLSPEYQQNYREDYLRQQINAQILANALQKKSAGEQKQALEEQLKKQAEITDQIALQNQLQKARLADIDRENQIEKARLAQTANGDALKIARGSAILDENALRKQIAETQKFSDERLKALTPEQRNGSAGKQIAAETDEAIKSFNSQITLVQINSARAIDEEIKKAKEKVKDLEKTYISTFESLYSRTGASNPFVAIFSEADKSLKELRQNLRGLPKELQDAALITQKELNSNSLFAARLESKISAYDLSEDAKNFRNPRESEADRAARTDRTINDYLARNRDNNIAGGLNAGNDYLRRNPKALDDPKLKQNIYEYAVLDNVTRAGYNPKDFIPFLAQERLRGGKDLSAKDRLNSKLDLIFSSDSRNAEQQSLADRQFLAVAKTVDPRELDARQREAAAIASEREARRVQSSEKDAQAERKQLISIQTKVYEETKALRQIAEKEGSQGVLRIINESSKQISYRETPSPKDTMASMNPNLSLGFFNGKNR